MIPRIFAGTAEYHQQQPRRRGVNRPVTGVGATERMREEARLYTKAVNAV